MFNIFKYFRNLFISISILLISLSTTSAVSKTNSNTQIFKEHRVTDPGMNNTLISTLLVPENWKVEGGATRTNNMLWNMPVLIDLSITAPDGRNVRFLPSFAFEFNHQSPGQKLQPTRTGSLYFPLPKSPGAWLLEMSKIDPAPGVTKLRLISEQDIPDMTKMLRKQNALRYQSIAQLNQTTHSMGFGSKFETRASKIVLQYEKDNKKLEDTIVMTWQYEIMINQGRVTQGSWNIMFMQGIGGPAGTDYLNDPELNTIFQSVRNNPIWIKEMNKYWMQLANIKHKGNMDAIRTAGKISRIQTEGANAVNDIMMKGWRSNNAIKDKQQTKTINTIHDQTIYQTPTGESVTLPSFYKNAYTDGNGRYLLHNDSLYEPNQDPALNNQTWQRIQERP